MIIEKGIIGVVIHTIVSVLYLQCILDKNLMGLVVLAALVDGKW